MNRPKLIVTQDQDGIFNCLVENASGSPVEGRGASVCEAIGEWCIQTGIVVIRCSPPAVLSEYKIANSYLDLQFDRPDQRD